MKKKILLKTLIPLTTVGVSLGAVLPLVSCSCNDSKNDGNAIIFDNEQDFANFIATTVNALLDASDASMDWSGKASNDADMIAWLNEKIDARMFCLLSLGELYRANNIDFATPVIFEFSQGIASCSILTKSYGQFIAIAKKEINSGVVSFDYTFLQDSSVLDTGNLSINEAYNNSANSNKKIGTSSSNTKLYLKTYLVNAWPNVKFPVK